MTNAAGFRYVDNRSAVGVRYDTAPADTQALVPATQAQVVLPGKPESVVLDHIEDKIALYDKAEREYNEMGVLLKQLKQDIADEMGQAEVAKVRGVKVFTYQMKKSWRTADLLKDDRWGDLASRYLKPVLVDKLDMAAFAKDHPAVALEFQTREFRRVTGTRAV